MTSYPSPLPAMIFVTIVFFLGARASLWLIRNPYLKEARVWPAGEALQAAREGELRHGPIVVLGKLALMRAPSFRGGLGVGEPGGRVRLTGTYWGTRWIVEGAGPSISTDVAHVHGWVRYGNGELWVTPWAIDLAGKRYRLGFWKWGAALRILMAVGPMLLFAWLFILGVWIAAIPLGVLGVFLLAVATTSSTPRRP